MKFSPTRSKTKQPDSTEHAYNYTLFLLNIRSRSEGEIREKMKGRGYTERVIEQIVATLVKEKLIDDYHYAEMYIDNLKRYKTYGFYMIKKKLMERRLPETVISAQMEEYVTIDDESLIAQKFIKQELREANIKEISQEAKQKMARKLQTRGFRADIVRKLVF